MRKAFLLFFISSTASAVSCPWKDYYPDPQNKTCFVDTNTPGTFQDAQRFCRRVEQFIPMPKDAATQKYLTYGVSSGGFIGLTCGTNSKDSCFWDSGEPLTFSNFTTGHPDISIGPCVIATKDGWFSQDCASPDHLIVCQYIPDQKPPICPTGHDFFHGNCYTNRIAPANTDPNDACMKNDSRLASIHSEGENQYVFSTLPNLEFSYIGLQKSPRYGYVWTDGIPVNYTNFFAENDIWGTCVVMDTSGDVVPKSKWVNFNCTTNQPSVATCNYPALIPQNVAPNCNGTIPVDGGEMFSSTGYPYPVDGPSNCIFFLSADPGQNITVTFSDTVLDAKATLSFYDNLFTKVPVAKWKNMVISNPQTYSFSTNYLKLEFIYNGTCPPDCTTKLHGLFAKTSSSATKQKDAMIASKDGPLMD